MEDNKQEIEKADIKPTTHSPTQKQIDFLRSALTIGTYKNKAAVAKDANVDRGQWYDWTKIPGFLEWFYEEYNKGCKSLRFELDAIGWKMAQVDFKYWEAMMKKYGGLAETKPSGPLVHIDATGVVANAETPIEAKGRLEDNLRLLADNGHVIETKSTD